MADTRVSFYVLAAADPAARLGYACRLIEKVWKLGQRIHASADDPRTADALDELLWTFRQGSFVPHERLRQDETPAAPITIGLAAETPPAADVLVNLSMTVPGWFSRFSRVAEIVDRRVRTARTRDPLIPRAVHQRRQHVLEHQAIWDALPMTAQRMGRRHERTLRQQRGELVPERLQQANWQDRHGASMAEMAYTSTVAGARACSLLLLTHSPFVGRS